MERHKGNGKRSLLDKVILGVVVAIALVVIALSFSNTALLARELGLNEYLTAGLVEILFASLLFIRGRQRATQRNVPFFLTIGYFTSLAFVTGVNMYGLYQQSPTVGPIVGGAISAAMWLMESVLVWLWVDSHRPHQKKMKELKREAKKEIAEIKLKQQIDWMRWEAQKPSLDLIKKARKADEKRKAAVAGGLPVFFTLAETATTYTDHLNGHPNEEIVASHDKAKENGHTGNRPVSDRPEEAKKQITTGRETATTATEGSGQLVAGHTGKAGKGSGQLVAETKKKVATEKPATKRPAEEKKLADKTATKQTASKVTTIRPTTDEEVFQVAVAYYRENGREPGQRELARLAGCSRHRADKAKARLKEEIKEEAI